MMYLHGCTIACESGIFVIITKNKYRKPCIAHISAFQAAGIRRFIRYSVYQKKAETVITGNHAVYPEFENLKDT